MNAVYPTILTDQIETVVKQVQQVQSFAEIRTVQIDIIDGQFADNLTVTPSDLPGVHFGELSCDFHLLTEEPLDYVYEAIEFKSHLPVRAIIGQVERMSSQVDFVKTVKHQEWQAGLSLDLGTPVEEIDPEVWSKLDIVQLMAVEAGFQGQEFQPHVFTKLDELQQVIDEVDRDVAILVDGGVSPEVLPQLLERGVDGIAVGSALWQAALFESMVTKLTEAEASE